MFFFGAIIAFLSFSEKKRINEDYNFTIDYKDTVEILSRDTVELNFVINWLGKVDSDYKRVKEWMPYNGFWNSSFRYLNQIYTEYGQLILVGYFGYDGDVKEYLISLDSEKSFIDGLLIHSEGDYIVIPSPPCPEYCRENISFIYENYSDIEYQLLGYYNYKSLFVYKVFSFYGDQGLQELHFFRETYRINVKSGEFYKIKELEFVESVDVKNSGVEDVVVLNRKIISSLHVAEP